MELKECTIIELKEPNWLCKHMKTSEAVNVVLQWIFVLNEFSKAQVLPCEDETMVTMLSWKAPLKVIWKI